MVGNSFLNSNLSLEPGERNANHSNILPGESHGQKAWWTAVHWISKSRAQLSTNTSVWKCSWLKPLNETRIIDTIISTIKYFSAYTLLAINVHKHHYTLGSWTCSSHFIQQSSIVVYLCDVVALVISLTGRGDSFIKMLSLIVSSYVVYCLKNFNFLKAQWWRMI